MINKEQLKHLAELAKIEVTEEELESFVVDINNILKYVQEIQNLDLSHFSTMISGPVQKLELREDQAKVCSEEIRANIIDQFSHKEGNYLKVPKIISK